jgi:hypothetical protein
MQGLLAFWATLIRTVDSCRMSPTLEQQLNQLSALLRPALEGGRAHQHGETGPSRTVGVHPALTDIGVLSLEQLFRCHQVTFFNTLH